MAALLTEVVANSNTHIQVLTANVYSNAVANGTTWRISTAGFTAPAPAGSVNLQIQPSVLMNVYFGPLGTNADTLVLSTAIPLSEVNKGVVLNGTGSFSYDALVTMRASSVGSAVAGGNVKVAAMVIDPIGVVGNPSVNGSVNGAMTANTTGNLSVYALAVLGQNANVVFEQCLITAQT